jgi:hypothetical protein
MKMYLILLSGTLVALLFVLRKAQQHPGPGNRAVREGQDR